MTRRTTALWTVAGISGALAVDAHLGGHGLSWIEDLCLPQDASIPTDYQPMEMNHDNHAAMFLVAGLSSAAGALFLSGANGSSCNPSKSTVDKALLTMISRVAIAAEKPDVEIAQQMFSVCAGKQIERRQVIDAFLGEYGRSEVAQAPCPFNQLVGTKAAASVLSAGFATGHALGAFPEMAVRAIGQAAQAMALTSHDVERIYATCRPREMAHRVIGRTA